MPSRAPRYRPGNKPPAATRQAQLTALDARRGSSAQRGYDAAWRRLRDRVLGEEPLCRFCSAAGRVNAAREVDHIRPVATHPELRLVRSNLRPLCTPCHSARTARGNRDPGETRV